MTKSVFYIIFLIFSLQANLIAQIEISSKFSQISKIVQQHYVDSINYDTLEKKIFNSFLHELDPHSSYFTSEEIGDMNNRLSGHFKGIGIRYNLLQDTIIIVAVLSKSPAFKAGLQKGDRILSINDIPVANKKIKQTKIHNLLGGEKGTNVYLSVLSPFENKIKNIKVIRGKIAYSSIDVAYMINDSTTYIKLSRFASISNKELVKEIRNTTNQGASNLILDLRNNGGGLLSAAIDVASEFLKQHKNIVTTKGDNLKTEKFLSTKKHGSFTKGNVIVLVNEYSASASEIVAGTLQDWDRAIIVGRRTFGKALVQRPFKLSDGSVIRLTVGRYYLPSGRMIQKPFTSGYNSYRNDLNDRIKSGELFIAEKNMPSDSTEHKSQINNRILYSYEGIMPDYFIPLDTIKYSSAQKEFIASGLFNKSLIDYSIQYSKIAKNYNEIEFTDNYRFTDKNIAELKFTDVISKNKSQLEQQQNHNFLNLAKAFFGEYLYGNGTYQKIINLNDEFVNKALFLFNHKEYFANYTVVSDSNE
ncbi:MAG: S41 family peptidase [Bacteroidales bacterium]|nr:S41 family peptidase [Bacteroidales bacterium]